MFSTSSIYHTLLLSKIPGLGIATYWKLMAAFHSSVAVFEAPDEALRRCLPSKVVGTLLAVRNKRDHPLRSEVDATLLWCEQHAVTVIDSFVDTYPDILKEIVTAPPILYVKGDIACLKRDQIAVVGSRKPSPAGKKNASVLSAELASCGAVITSGLALGVDSCAHRGALEGGGRTVAVLGSSIDTIYPRRNQALACKIIEQGGALVSEFPLHKPPVPANFPQRNRLISGLSMGVLVIEAAIKSGSLITARFAAEQNREVMAVPGSLLNPLSRGCHGLIKQGAKLVECAEDVIEEFPGCFALKAPERAALPGGKLSEEQSRIFAEVDAEPTTLEAIAAKTNTDTGSLLAVLMDLEIKGLVTQEGGVYQRLHPHAN